MEIKTTIELITPDRARELLKANTANRPLNKTNVEYIKRGILNGEWKLNGDAIRISKNNVLIDGQHRLMACVESGIPIESFVINGLDDDVFTTIDVGAARTLGTMLSIDGVKHYNGVASAAVLLFEYQRGNQPNSNNARNKPTKKEMISYIENNIGLVDSADFVFNAKTVKKLIAPSYGVFLHYVFNQINPEDCFNFFSALNNGENLSSENPIYVLREKLIGGNFTSLEKSAFCIFAWNKYRKKETTKIIRWWREGAQKQDYPKAI